MNKRLDCVIATIPFIEYYLPPAAPAALKGHLVSKGFTVKTYDLNINVKKTFRKSETDREKLNKVSNYFLFRKGPVEDILIMANKHVSDDLLKEIDAMINNWIDMILEHNPKYLGISVFSDDSRVACRKLLEKLNKRKHDSKIFVGGYGLNKQFLDTIKHLIHFYTMGQGELICENLLKGNHDFKGINGYADAIDDLNALGTSDYDDYNFDSYDQFYFKQSTVQITGSWGCVRNCSFCNIADLWPKYRWRSGESIINEIKRLYETKGVNNFFFTDSLTNGNLKSYMEMVESLANYRYTTNSKITWGGQHIVRKEKGLPKDYFTLTSQSGAYNLVLGVESGSDNVLREMKKKFTREDLDFFIENFDNHGITCQYLMIIGYPTESDDDFQKTLDLFYNHQKYVASGTIHGATLNTTMQIYPGMPLWSQKHTGEMMSTPKESVWKFNKSNDSRWGWVSTVVPNLNWEERFYRRLVAQEVCEMLKWPTISSDRELKILEKTQERYLEWKKSGSSKIHIDQRPDVSHLTSI